MHSHLGPSCVEPFPLARRKESRSARCHTLWLADPRILWAESAAARGRRNGRARKPHPRVHAHRRGENAHAAVARDFQGAVQARLGAAQARLEVKAESRPFQAFRVGPDVAEWPPDCLVPKKRPFLIMTATWRHGSNRGPATSAPRPSDICAAIECGSARARSGRGEGCRPFVV
jgi:hypothetical protein